MSCINKVFFSGLLSSDAVEIETGSGFECIFHVNIPAGSGGSIWVATYWRGKKAEESFDLLERGELVFIEGALGKRNPKQAGAIIVNASSVVLAATECNTDD